MQYNTDIMQHFLLALYHSEGILAFDFEPALAADLTQRLKNSYPRSHGVLGIGYSYCDLQFLAESDVGIGLSPNLPTDLMVDSLDKVIEALQIGPYLLQTLSQIFNQIIYQVLSLTTIVIIYEIALITHNESLTLNSTLVFIYTVIFSTLQVLFTIFANRKSKKLTRAAYYVNFRNSVYKTYLTIVEAIVHGAIIIIVTLTVLPAVRLNEGRLLT